MKKNIISAIVVVLLAIMVAVFMVLGTGYEIYREYDIVSYEKEWTVQINDGEPHSVEFPFAFEADKSDNYKFATVLSASDARDDDYAVFIGINHSFFKVHLGDKEVYSYAEDDLPSSRHSPGSPHMAVHLDDDYVGKPFVLEIIPAIDGGGKCWVQEPKFASYDTFMRECFFDSIIQWILAAAFFLMGIIMLGAGIFVKDDEYNCRFGSIGLFSLLMGIFSMSGNVFLHYIVANPYTAYLINFTVFAALPIPLLHFLMEFADSKFRKPYYLCIIVATVNFFGQMVLHFKGILDLREMVSLSHGIACGALIFVVVTMFLTESDMKQRKKLFVFSVLVLVIGIVLDVAMSYLDFLTKPCNGFYTQLGILAFITIHLLRIAREVKNTYSAGVVQNFYKKLAFKDSLTGLSNRTAYTTSCDVVNEQRDRYKDLIVFCADVNNLKTVNDTMGHAAGDELICSVAQYLREAFSPYGVVFRTGGDEFVGMLRKVSEETVFSIYEELEREIAEENLSREFDVEFAIGFDALRADDKSVAESVKRADTKMYLDKKRKKENKNIVI